MKAAVISVQGAVPEHVLALRNAMANLGIDGQAYQVRRPDQLADASCIVIPGGESTAISKLLRRFGLQEPIRKAAADGVPIMGTCAGLVLLAREGDDEVEKTGTELLGLMDLAVDRNAFGRQRESFEAQVDIEGVADRFPAVFIRAPAIRRAWGGCRVIAYHDGIGVMARQDNILALSFHPELSQDPRIHEMLLRMV